MSLAWEESLPARIPRFVSPIVACIDQEERVIIVTENGVYCLSSQNGDIIWHYPSVRGTYTPACVGNYLFIPAAESLVCLDLETGQRRWINILDASIAGHLTIAPGPPGIYWLYLLAGKRLYAFNVSGQLLWQSTDLGPGFENQGAAVDDSGYIYIVTLGSVLGWYDYRIYKFNAAGGLIWVDERLFFEPGGARMSPTIGADGKIYFGLVYAFGWSSSLYAYHSNGELEWRKTDDAGLAYSSPAVNDSMIIYCAYGRSASFVRRLDTAGNLIIWSYPTNIRYSSPAITGNGWIVYGTGDGKFQILGSGGELIYQYDCGDSLVSPAIGRDGIYIAGGRKVFKFAATGVALSEKNAEKNAQQHWPSLFTGSSLEKSPEIFDVSGRIVSGKGNLPAGIYFIRINPDGKQIRARVVVVR
ncbi:MAG: PQQ-binding-like beta-propeller repeat protein [Patescibacteria group bacterium]